MLIIYKKSLREKGSFIREAAQKSVKQKWNKTKKAKQNSFYKLL